MIGVALLSTFIIIQSAFAEGGLVVKLYVCPQGQAATMADTLRNEYGVIPGVRVAADERTSRVIVQAPAEVQSRVSQRMAAAFPDLQPAPEKGAAGPIESRQIPLKRIQADQLETALWNTLGNRLTAIPEQRPRIARLSSGACRAAGRSRSGSIWGPIRSNWKVPPRPSMQPPA